MSTPLRGITVLSLEQAISAPLCTRHLADLGARVIKIESPGCDPVVRGLDAHFAWLNHGKESVQLELTQPADMEVFARLLARADVMVSNLAPGTLGRLGMDPPDLLAVHPRLIVVDIAGYPAGACGASAPVVPAADIGTALSAYSAVLAALYDRDKTGRGTVIPIAMLDVIAEMMSFALDAGRVDTGRVDSGQGGGGQCCEREVPVGVSGD